MATRDEERNNKIYGIVEMAREIGESNLAYKNGLLKSNKNIEKFIFIQPYPELTESSPQSHRLS
jgi:hypothetical protein